MNLSNFEYLKSLNIYSNLNKLLLSISKNKIKYRIVIYFVFLQLANVDIKDYINSDVD